MRWAIRAAIDYLAVRCWPRAASDRALVTRYAELHCALRAELHHAIRGAPHSALRDITRAILPVAREMDRRCL